jgi:hypothetical protein
MSESCESWRSSAAAVTRSRSESSLTAVEDLGSHLERAVAQMRQKWRDKCLEWHYGHDGTLAEADRAVDGISEIQFPLLRPHEISISCHRSIYILDSSDIMIVSAH